MTAHGGCTPTRLDAEELAQVAADHLRAVRDEWTEAIRDLGGEL